MILILYYWAVEGYDDIESNNSVVADLFVGDSLYETLVKRPAHCVYPFCEMSL